MTEKASKFYSRGAEKFKEKYSEEKIDPDYMEMIEDFAEKTGAGKILDAGCGPGRDSKILTEKGFKVTGIDLSERMIEIAEQKKGKYHRMDVRDLEFQDEKFDGVLANQLIIFFDGEEREKAFRELERVLKPGGTIFLGLKKGEKPFKRERYDSSITQYPLTEEKARELLENFKIHRKDITERKDKEPGFMNFIARKKQ